VTDFHDDLDVEDDFDDQGHYAGTDVETLLHRVADLIGNARPMPLSASVMINRDEVLELVEEALSRLPEELRAARWLLRERDEFLAKVQREGDDILDAARVRAERMVQRTEVVRNAQHTARQVIDDAEGEARRLRHEAEDFCDQKLAQFEIVLDRTIRTVQAGRSRLQATVPDEEEEASPAAGGEPGFFDQDGR
jgi:vacuolar-type H+-ATPase subunit H